MSHHDRDIDALLRRSAERQLADFDWVGLSRNIDGHLAAGVPARRGSQWWHRVALAACIALVAGVLIYAILCNSRSSPNDAAPGNAVVRIAGAARPTGAAQVVLPPPQTPVQCEVRVLPSARQPGEDQMPARWCIIAKREPLIEERSGNSSSDILCLF